MATTQGIKLDPEIRQRLKSLGEKRNRSPHWLMCSAIESFLEREEKYEAEKAEDMQRWDEYLNTGHSIDNNDVQTWLESLIEGKATKCPE